jgi:integrase
MIQLTAKKLSDLKPADKAYIVFDVSPRGFGVRVLPTGRRSYIFRYKIGHNPSRQMVVGDADSMPLTAARDIATKLYVQTRDGICPMSERARQDKTMTVSALWEDYKANKTLAATTLINMESVFTRYVLPHMGTTIIGAEAVTKKVKDLHAALVRDRKPAQANSVANKVKQIFGYAVEREYIKTNPVAFKAASEVGFSTTLTLEEAVAVWNACEEFAADRTNKWWRIGYAFQWLIATGCRKGEAVQHLHWAFIDNEKVVIPWALIKTGRKTKEDLVIYQSDLTQAILSRVPLDNQLVFGVRGQPIASGHDTRLWKDILSLAGVSRRVRIHDIRHTFASIAGNNSTMTLKEVGLLLNHSRTATTERYTKYFDRTKETAAETMATTLSGLFSVPQDDQSDQQVGQCQP